MKIQVVDYLLFEYEIEFLANELRSLGAVWSGKIERNAVLTVSNISPEDAMQLTFIKGVWNDDSFIESYQYLREKNDNDKRVQSKRYGPHYLHEYKGRFNPQMPRSLLLSNFSRGDIILDPFMGSGTTLIEARGLGIESYGVELNPMAHMITLAKKYYEETDSIEERNLSKTDKLYSFSEESKNYLKRWFPEKQFIDLNEILLSIESLLNPKSKVIYSILLSNLLREHSLQDPRDLRIRRRTEIPYEFNLKNNFIEEVSNFKRKHSQWIKSFGISKIPLHAVLGDSRYLQKVLKQKKINGTVSSPPYASALPYVDTYRLSMIALGLIKPDKIQTTEKNLIGARDVDKNDERDYELNFSQLPLSVRKIIQYVKDSIENSPNSGFRKKAVPYFLTNYSSSMLSVLNELYGVEVVGAKNYWVLGPNKVKLNNEWFFIDTPYIVGELAKKAGFKNVTIEAVQAYQRYNIHSKNSINKESILIFIK